MSWLNPGDTVVCRCPKCRSGNLSISEVFEVSDMTMVVGGVVQDTEPGAYPRATGAIYMRCDNCEHRWRSRRSMDELEGATT
jgi:hypothetical protein